ncbi:hypothetical protein CDD82_395 [Ophiocordyceps australis]|uniref:Uncharacterized protein n=1 Tax=Ophiocordyceps australis TaxID=1399860 RepID=A0A2C5ZQ94_9HYPO|nr:hypothetical protein CDD82_395 [Ophiocordyceps australis]
MQATLEEVELSASGGTHVFGPGHDGKLAELRKAQIELAHACAKYKVDDSTLPRGGNLATEDEAQEPDVLLAREKRREANNEYFRCVNDGVVAVVAKLEDVAVAMREVEQESKEVWSEGTA